MLRIIFLLQVAYPVTDLALIAVSQLIFQCSSTVCRMLYITLTQCRHSAPTLSMSMKLADLMTMWRLRGPQPTARRYS